MNRCKLIPDPHALDGGMLLHCGPIIPELPRIERDYVPGSVRPTWRDRPSSHHENDDDEQEKKRKNKVDDDDFCVVVPVVICC